MTQHIARLTIALLLLVLAASGTSAADAKKPKQEDYYRIVDFPLPKDCVLEVGGLGWLDKDQSRLLACTRRGELWVIDNPYADQPGLEGETRRVKGPDGKTTEKPISPADVVRFKRMLFGMHEPLGMLVNPGRGFPDGIYMAQRTELTRVRDTDGDDLIDDVQTFSAGWQGSGSYHEYAFGPKLGGDGRMWVTLNRPFGGGQESKAHWRGWAVAVDNQGKMHPVCPGLRSPAGLGTNAAGEMFYTDNQGDHVAVCKLSHLKPHTFHGNPVGLASADHPLSNFKVPLKDYPKRGMPWGEAMKLNPKLQAPAVWFPYPHMGKSHTDVMTIDADEKFGPFDGQLMVGDLSTAQIVRVALELVDGEYQGACFPFLRGFTPPVLRVLWGKDGRLFVGGSSRGWGGGRRPYGLARVQWTGETPFEIHKMKAEKDGFTLSFTQPVDKQTAGDVESYAMKSWMYHYHKGYGDKPRDEQTLKIRSATPSTDGKSVRLVVDRLRPYYVHELKAPGVKSTAGGPLLHDAAWYTLNRIPK